MNGVAETNAAISDEGDVRAGRDLTRGVGEFRQGQQGFADGVGVAQGTAAQIHGAESRPFRDSGGQRIERQRREHDFAGGDAGT